MTQQSNGSINSTSVLDDHLSLISITINTFGGYRHATRDVIAKLGGTLPASRAITEGSVKVFPTEPLSEFHSLRRNLFRKMSARGIRALGSKNVFAIPRVELETAEKEIAEAFDKIAAVRDDLEATYDAKFEEYVKACQTGTDEENAAVDALLREKKYDRIDAISRITFGSSVFRIQPEVREGQDAGQGVESIVQGLGRALFEEVAADMAKLLDNDVFAKQRVGQKSLRPLHAALKKMAGLVFIDERNIQGAIGFINGSLALLPMQGYIEDKGIDLQFSTLRRLVETLADADDLVNAAGKFANGLSARDILFPPQPVAPAPAVQEQAVATVQAETPKAETAEVAATPVAVPAPTVVVAVPSSLPPLPMAAVPVMPPRAPLSAAFPLF